MAREMKFVVKKKIVRSVPAHMVEDETLYRRLRSEGWTETKDKKLISEFFTFVEPEEKKKKKAKESPDSTE